MRLRMGIERVVCRCAESIMCARRSLSDDGASEPDVPALVDIRYEEIKSEFDLPGYHVGGAQRRMRGVTGRPHGRGGPGPRLDARRNQSALAVFTTPMATGGDWDGIGEKRALQLTVRLLAPLAAKLTAKIHGWGANGVRNVRGEPQTANLGSVWSRSNRRAEIGP
jgi:hypothetical protein